MANGFSQQFITQPAKRQEQEESVEYEKGALLSCRPFRGCAGCIIQNTQTPGTPRGVKIIPRSPTGGNSRNLLQSLRFSNNEIGRDLVLSYSESANVLKTKLYGNRKEFTFITHTTEPLNNQGVQNKGQIPSVCTQSSLLALSLATKLKPMSRRMPHKVPPRGGNTQRGVGGAPWAAGEGKQAAARCEHLGPGVGLHSPHA